MELPFRSEQVRDELARMAADLSRPKMNPADMPTAFTFQLPFNMWKWELDYSAENPDASRVRLLLYSPMFPFMKIEIPIGYSDDETIGIRKFVDDACLALDALINAVENGETPTPV